MSTTDKASTVLIFDVGANVGVKTAEFVARGARVVCFEPVSECVEKLHIRFDSNPSVTIVPCALGAVSGTRSLSICSESPTISTFSDSWKKGRFQNYKWDSKREVPISTLDAAISAHGRPDYVKIDVEGFELPVLQGLSQQIPVLSFEFCREGLDQTQTCLERLSRLGYSHFNVAYGEMATLRHDRWRDAPSLFAELREHPTELVWGDVYASATADPDKALAPVLPAAPLNDEIPTSQSDTLTQLLWRGLTFPGLPLRLHLGSGEQQLPGYINIDYSSEHHNVMQVRPDLTTDITRLTFPLRSVDEVRLHHVFEHFNRVVALGLLIRWQRWLKPGGRLVIETPDFEADARAFLERATVQGDGRKKRVPGPVKDSFYERMSAVRSLEGDQTAAWGYHIGQWFGERFEQTLGELGFGEIRIQHCLSSHIPPLHNVTATAVRGPDRTDAEQLEAAYRLLWASTVAEAERPTWNVWCAQLRRFLEVGEPPNPPVAHHSVEQVHDAPKNQSKSLDIAVRLVGGLGNQLFQYAAARSACLRLGTELILDLSQLRSDPLRRFELDAFRISGLILAAELREADLARYDERSYHYEERFESILPGTLLVGYFQSDKYFANCVDRIREDLKPSGVPSPAFAAYAAAIRTAALPVSVHVRRGDFVSNPDTLAFHGICGQDYYDRALAIVKGLVGSTPTYFVFSDDREAARNVLGPDARLTFVETDANRAWEDLLLMSLCRHHVLANSSFSWWGAWLNGNPNKIVVAPRYWVSPQALRQLNTTDLYPPGTIIL